LRTWPGAGPGHPAPLLVATLGRLPQARLADANTLFNIVERVAGSFGVALLATFFQVRVHVHTAAFGRVPEAGSGLIALSQLPALIRTRVQDAATAGFHDTVWLMVGLGVVGFLVSLFLTAPEVEDGAVEHRVSEAERPPL